MLEPSRLPAGPGPGPGLDMPMRADIGTVHVHVTHVALTVDLNKRMHGRVDDKWMAWGWESLTVRLHGRMQKLER